MLRWNRLAVVLAGVLSLAACGHGTASTPAAAPAVDQVFPGQSAAQLLAKARTAADGAAAVQIDGSLTQSGKKLGLKIVAVAGKGLAGDVTIDGAQIRVRRVGVITYAQLSAKFLASQGPMGASLGQLLGNKWLKADDSIAAAAGLGNLNSFSSASSAMDISIPKNGKFTRVPGKDVGGVPTTGVEFASSSSAKQAGTLYIAATGEPYPMLLESPTLGTITLSNWGKTVPIMAPKAKEVVDLGDLGLAGLGG
jgi:hypothetical protein